MPILKLFSSKRIRPGFKTILFILSLLGTTGILIGTQNSGIGLTPDSVNYIAAARNIAHENGIVGFNDKPLTIYPPLYPICLGLTDIIFKVDPVKSAVFFNAILFGIIVYSSGMLLFRYLNSSVPYSLLGTFSISVGIPLVMVSQLALSETLFVCFIILYLISSEIYTQKGNITSLLILASIVALACLTRYIGVILIIAGFISILFTGKNKLSVKIKHLFIFTVVAIVPVSIFLIRNYFLMAVLSGYPVPAKSDFFHNFKLTYNTIYSWYIPKWMPFDNLAVVLLMVIIGILTFWFFIKGKANIIKFCKNKFNLIITVIFYLGFLIISSSIVSYNEIGDRLLSPIFVPITILIIIFILKILKLLTEASPKILKITVFSSALFIWYVLWVSPCFPFNRPVLKNSTGRELGYNSYFWMNSQTINYLREDAQLNNNYTIYSNDPYALYILANLKSEITPTLNGLFNGLVSYKKVNNVLALKGIWPEQYPSYLVWFNRYRYLKSNLYKLEELTQIAELKQIKRLNDGTIYLIKSR